MPEYVIGKERTRRDHQTSYVIHVTVPKRIYQRLEALRDSLQKEIGPAHDVSVASVTRRLLYAHPFLKKLAHRHYEPPDDGNDLVT